MEPDAKNINPYAALYGELDDAATAAYLARIRAIRPARPDRAALDALILAHQLAVPFENLDIFDAGRPVSLAVGDIEDKVIRRGRGGYCFELNALFYDLLRALGYDAFQIAGGVIHGEGVPPPFHRATAVRLDGRLLYCDVGFGGPMPGAAVAFGDAAWQEAADGAYRLRPHGEGTDRWTLCRETDGGEEALILVCRTPLEATDFLGPNEYCSRSRHSMFTQKRFVNLRTANGALTIDGNVMRVREGGRTEERPLRTRRALYEALEDAFGIIVTLDV
jgi:N-hydroxyarylamine O-acetyltransferase